MGRVLDISAPNGQARLHIIEGEVLHRQDESRTEVSTQTTGGGGYIHPTHGGYVSAPTTRTTVTQHRQQRVWIAEHDGKRHEFVLTGDQCDFAAPIGHRLRIVKGGAVTGSSASLLWAHNLTLGQTYAFEGGDLWHWALKHGLARYPLLYRLVFRWSPWLLASYVLLFWFPLMDVWTRAHRSLPDLTLSALWKLRGVAFSEWSPSIVVRAYSGASIDFWLTLAMALVGVFIVWLMLELTGYLLVGWWWRRLVQRPFRDRVVAAYAA